jgi:hypothetical protein
MRSNRTFLLMVILLFFGLCGCRAYITDVSPKQLIKGPTFNKGIDDATLINIVDPEGYRALTVCTKGIDDTMRNKLESARGSLGTSDKPSSSNESSSSDDDKLNASLQRALYCAQFYPAPEEHRNDIQAFIMARSQEPCDAYLNALKSISTWEGFGTGAAATILGGLGSIFTNVSTARALSGSSGIVSGTSAEFNANFFHNLAAEVIVPAILLKRATLASEIAEKRKQKITEYTIGDAISDAIEYHHACSLAIGIAAATETINQAQKTNDQGIGIKTLADSINVLKTIKVAVAPSAPTDVKASAGDKLATVTFTPPASDGGSPITKYTVTSDPDGKTGTGSDAKSPITVNGLTNGQSYTFKVTATNTVGDSAPSAPSASIKVGTPGAPIGVKASTGDKLATVTFTPPASNGGSAITGFTVTSNPAGGVDSNAASTLTTHTVTGLTNGTAYTFTVTATNAVGDSAPSAPSASIKVGTP